MCIFGDTPDVPETQQTSAPQQNSDNVIMTAQNMRDKQRAAMGASNSRLTGAMGDTSMPGTNKTLLG